jgi:hypothetical protein
MEPERQPREHTVSCLFCQKQSWNLDAICDDCRPVEEERAS